MAEQSDCQNRPWVCVSWLGNNLSYDLKRISCLLFMEKVKRAAPNFLANAAGNRFSKKNHKCPPLPDCDRSTATGISNSAQTSLTVRDIVLPACLIKIHCQKVAGFIRKHGIDTGNDTPSQMIFYDMFIQHGILLVGTFGTGGLWLAAQSRLPLIQTNGRISRFCLLFVLPFFRIYIITTFEKRHE